MQLPNLRRLLPLRIRWAGKRVYRISYAQEGEDLLLDRLFHGKQLGFYIDIGAHHPKRFSNTHLFYERGWMGINVDPLPGAMELFRRMRPRDLNVGYAVGKAERVRNYYMFQDPANNTFDESVASLVERTSSNRIVKILPIKTLPLREILERHLPTDKTVDFMTVDVEGLDEEVLRSNDWSRYRPTVLVVEMLSTSLKEVLSHSVTIFLRANGYTAHSKLHNSVFFIDTKTY